MSRFKRLLQNLRYMSKKNLREGHAFDLDTEDIISSILYFIPNSSVVRPMILDDEQTVDKLCNTTKSIARFGDGELMIIAGRNIPFQQYDEKLANRLREILLNNNANLLIGINHWYFHPVYNPKQNDLSRNFMLYSMPKHRKNLIQFIDFSKQYCDAGFTGLRTGQTEKNIGFFNKIRTIWNKKEVVLVGCREAFNTYKYDLFDNRHKNEICRYLFFFQ